MARVEEARRPAGGQRLAGDPGADAGHGVLAVLEDLGDALDVLGLGDLVRGPLRRLVGVQRPLVVGVLARVELAPGHLDVEQLQLLTERGDVLEGELAHRRELGLLALEGLALVGLDDGRPPPRPRWPARRGRSRTPWGQVTCADPSTPGACGRHGARQSAHDRTHRGQPAHGRQPRGGLRPALRPPGPRGHRLLGDAPVRRGRPRRGGRATPSWCTWTGSRSATFDLGRYDVTVTITAYEQDREIAWKILGRVRPADRPRLRLPDRPAGRAAGRAGHVLLRLVRHRPRVARSATSSRSSPRAPLKATLGILERTVRRGYPRG